MIPFNKPVLLGTELQRMAEAIVVNGHVAGNGPFGRRCEKLLEAQLNRRALLVGSCTQALEMVGLLLDLAPGDEVVLPSYTFVSTANAFAMRGARLVFADVDAHGNLAVEEVARLLGPRTRAVVTVHYAGNSCDLQALQRVCGDVPLVEDAAQALGGRFDGRPLGSFGRLATISFHETKNVGCGEGGALLLDAALVERAEILRDKGTNRARFLAGLVDKYTWVDVGSSYVLSDLNAAYLVDQLEQQERIQARRMALHEEYQRALAGPLERAGAYFVRPHARNTPNHHIFAVVFRTQEQRDGFIAHMRSFQITAPFHYVALHLSPMGRRHHPAERPLPNAERLTGCLARLPLFFNMTSEEQSEVVARTCQYLERL